VVPRIQRRHEVRIHEQWRRQIVVVCRLGLEVPEFLQQLDVAIGIGAQSMLQYELPGIAGQVNRKRSRFPIPGEPICCDLAAPDRDDVLCGTNLEATLDIKADTMSTTIEAVADDHLLKPRVEATARKVFADSASESATEEQVSAKKESRRREREDRALLDAVDKVLDKISARGIESLTEEERRLLDEVSRRHRTN